MKVEIKNALTQNNCGTAITLATQLFESKYSDNDIRMLYASAYACNAGIVLYTVFDNLSSLGGANPIGEFARMFPSTTSDSRLQSTWFAMDALQTILLPGSVVGSSDQVIPNAYNTGSVLTQDRTSDSNVFGMFISMAMIGTTANRYGNPDASYNQQTNFTWTTKAAVQADTTGVACGLAAGFLNFFDTTHATIALLSGGAAAGVNAALTQLEGPLLLAAGNNCTADGYSNAECNAAKVRLRYRGSCNESGANASVAAGIIAGVNLLWL